MENKPKKPIPTPEARPDLYDHYDGSGRLLFSKTGVKGPDYIQKLIDERQGARHLTDGSKYIFIENEGALFKGPSTAWPREIWDGTKFTPYTGDVPKGIEWGNKIDQAEAERLMGVNKDT
ncbi:hypothetical protein [Microvirga zambiensis]|uniref:hypothetical protein n=1 Tax=Microvirga zambiensis TaxID=1402137 RepID=UPI00191E0993|nr:hypothetical protein [Microvirga zambiensis]